jgi:hypothetical protein
MEERTVEMAKPIGHMHFAGTYEVPVYSADDVPEQVFDVAKTYLKLRSLLSNRETRKKMSESQYLALLNEYERFSILSRFGVQTYPMIREGDPDECPEPETLDLLRQLKQKVKGSC